MSMTFIFPNTTSFSITMISGFNCSISDNNSLTINPESIDEIADAIKKMMKDKDLYRKKKEYTCQNSDSYSILVRARKILSFIEEKA